MSALVERVHRLGVERDDLYQQLEDRDHRILGLEEKLLASNQRRQDVVKRLDDLIAHMDQLDARFEAEAEAD